jgi:hypothetical protein
MYNEPHQSKVVDEVSWSVQFDHYLSIHISANNLANQKVNLETKHHETFSKIQKYQFINS